MGIQNRLTSEALVEIIEEQRPWFENLSEAVPRNILMSPHFVKKCLLKEIVIITGVRRCGKSFLLKMIWDWLRREKEIPPENGLAINFENEKLLHFVAEDFDRLLECHRQRWSPSPHHPLYLFLDEIQNVEGWEKFLSRLQQEGNYKIFVTGSNARLLSKEMSSALTGRHVTVILHPFSFAEFSRYKGLDHLQTATIRKAERSHFEKTFLEYLSLGGFPAVVLQNYRPLLQDYLQNIIYRDIVTRHRIRHEATLREIVAFVMANIGVDLSLDKISRMTRVKSLMTVKNYLGYLTDAYLFCSIPKHSYSVKQQIYNPDKYYPMDTGLYQETAFIGGENRGRVLETAVLLELKRRFEHISYYRGHRECDFVVQEKTRVSQVIQVTESLGSHNEERELGGLGEAMEAYQLKEGLILTKDQSDETEVSNKTIRILPAWQWCLTP